MNGELSEALERLCQLLLELYGRPGDALEEMDVVLRFASGRQRVFPVPPLLLPPGAPPAPGSPGTPVPGSPPGLSPGLSPGLGGRLVVDPLRLTGEESGSRAGSSREETVPANLTDAILAALRTEGRFMPAGDLQDAIEELFPNHWSRASIATTASNLRNRGVLDYRPRDPGDGLGRGYGEASWMESAPTASRENTD